MTKNREYRQLYKIPLYPDMRPILIELAYLGGFNWMGYFVYSKFRLFITKHITLWISEN